MTLLISSIKNPRIKAIIALEKPRERKLSGVFVIEGIREVSLAQQGGYEIESIYLCENIHIPDRAYPISFDATELILVTAEVFGKLAYREDSGGVLAIAKMQAVGLDQLPKGTPDKPSLFLVLEQVEKPGNIGAMLRTADAAGLSGVIICDPATDFFNPNVVRSSVGTLFTVPVAAASNQETLEWCRHNKINTFAAALTATKPYHAHDFRDHSALLLGSESQGLSDFWLQHADHQIIIPMYGKIDSMNVSNAAAVLIFEALRQRSSSGK